MSWKVASRFLKAYVITKGIYGIHVRYPVGNSTQAQHQLPQITLIYLVFPPIGRYFNSTLSESYNYFQF